MQGTKFGGWKQSLCMKGSVSLEKWITALFPTPIPPHPHTPPTCRQYCAHLALPPSPSPSPSPPLSSSHLLHASPVAATLTTAAARQLARAQMSAARDVLVLVAVLLQQGAVGTQPLSMQQQAGLQGCVWGGAATLLQQATLVFWLCSTHTTTGGRTVLCDSPT